MKVLGSSKFKITMEEMTVAKELAMAAESAIEVISHGVSDSYDHYDIHYVGTPKEVFDAMVDEFDEELMYISWYKLDRSSELGLLLVDYVDSLGGPQ